MILELTTVNVSFFIGDIPMEDDDSLKLDSAMHVLYKVVERCLWGMSDLLLLLLSL